MPMTAPGKFDSNGAWDGFRGEIWQEEINVRDFIQKNYTPYDGDESFLADPTERTQKLWNHVQKLQKEEREKGGVLECETEVVSGLTAYGPGYISEDMKDLEQIVGLQTDKPLKRAFMPYGGIRMAVQAAETYGYEINPELKKIFTTYVTTHNDAVFGAYTPEMRLARKTHVVTGLPDTYGRGRIVGDYRRVALYGIDRLIEAKKVAHYRAGCGNAAADRVVISPFRFHNFVILILNGTCINRNFSRIFFKSSRKVRAVKNGKVRFRAWSHIFQSMKETIVCLCYHVTSVQTCSADFQGYPGRVTGE